MRWFGIDSGSSHFAYSLLDVDNVTCKRVERFGSREHFKGTDVLDVGHKVPLTKPWKDEGGRLHTHKSVVDQNDIDALYSQLKGLLEIARVGQGVCGLAIERSIEVSQRKRGIGANMATCLKNTEGLALMTYALGRALGYVVVMARPEEVRKALYGNAKASNAQISAAFAKIDDWLTRSNEHERDAYGVGKFCARRYLAQQPTVRKESEPRLAHLASMSDDLFASAFPICGHGAG